MVSRLKAMTRTYIRKTPEERFWNKVKKTKKCWIWTGGIKGGGYGEFGINNRMVSTHRFSYEIHYGPIQKGMFVLHTCDNPLCVNPDHLWLGTQADNMRDKAMKGRQLQGKDNPAYKHGLYVGDKKNPAYP